MKNKLPEDMTPEERKEIKIQFAPGAFDSFEGSQEELNELMADIQKMILDGSLFENSKPLDLDELLESNDPADRALAEKLIRSFDNDSDNRNLQ